MIAEHSNCSVSSTTSRVMNAVLLSVLLCQVSATTISGAIARERFGTSAATATAIDVLRHMQSSGDHLAVVTGGAAADSVGILTIEDIVKELVGTIEEPERR